MAGVRLKPVTIDSRTVYLHFLNLDLSLKERGIFSRDSTIGNVQKTDRSTFVNTVFTCTVALNELNGFLVASEIAPGTSRPKSNVITTRVHKRAIKAVFLTMVVIHFLICKYNTLFCTLHQCSLIKECLLSMII